MKSNPLKVFVDPNWISNLKTFERLPLAESLLWHNKQYSDKSFIDPFERSHFVRRIDFNEVFKLSPLNICDAILYPAKLPEYPYGTQNLLVQKVKHAAEKTDKPVIVHTNTRDILNHTIQVGNPFKKFIYINQSLVNNRTPSNFYPAPSFVPDIYKKRNNPKILKNTFLDMPTVGFCGFAPPLKQPWCKTKFFDFLRMGLCLFDNLHIDSEKIARRFRTNTKHAHRLWSIIFLKLDNRIKTSFIFRSDSAFQDKSYYEGIDHSASKLYYDNIEKNLYNITSRGTENYSIRFYETFCLGRIPIMVNTDLVLPFCNIIDYNRQCVMVDKDQLFKLPDVLLRYHRKHFKEGLVNIQNENRLIWEKYFTPIGFYQQVPKMLRNFI